jgi:hypothetical protein
MRRRTCKRFGVIVLLAALAVVQGCREDEQERPLLYEPGTYLGQPDPPLEPEQVDALRQRAKQQQY